MQKVAIPFHLCLPMFERWRDDALPHDLVLVLLTRFTCVLVESFDYAADLLLHKWIAPVSECDEDAVPAACDFDDFDIVSFKLDPSDVPFCAVGFQRCQNIFNEPPPHPRMNFDASLTVQVNEASRFLYVGKFACWVVESEASVVLVWYVQPLST